MIQMQTMLNAADNSGARQPDVHQGAGRLEAPLRGGGRCHQGEHPDAIPRGKVKKGEVYDAVVVRTEVRRAPRRTVR